MGLLPASAVLGQRRQRCDMRRLGGCCCEKRREDNEHGQKSGQRRSGSLGNRLGSSDGGIRGHDLGSWRRSWKHDVGVDGGSSIA
ncbi:hypothetical protein M0R45_001997 [Rubus argutus]|uniref:Uncharacterized protein n=1 Tax=Rubus argutus TaxID=59490 RepID=A0AAW1VJ95_RUBAR